jgi:Ca2+/Na+ antiporter
MLARRHDARADWCAADRHERHFTMIRFGWMAYVYIWHSSYIYIYIYIYVYIYIYIYIEKERERAYITYICYCIEIEPYNESKSMFHR